MLSFASFEAIVAIGSDLASVSKINAEPCLIPVAHFLATGSYGNKCAAAHSKLFHKSCGPLSVLTLAIAACSPASAHWIASIRRPMHECYWAVGIEHVLHMQTLIYMHWGVGR